MYFSEEKVLINLFTTFSGNSVSFIMFSTGNNFSIPSPLFLESECSPGEPSAESSLRLLLKKLLGSFCKWNIIKCMTWKGAKAAFSDCRMFPCDDFYYELLTWIAWVYFTVENPNYGHYQTQHPGRDRDVALKSQQWLLQQRARYFCAAFLKLLLLSSHPWPWSRLPEINGKAHVDFGGI